VFEDKNQGSMFCVQQTEMNVKRCRVGLGSNPLCYLIYRSAMLDIRKLVHNAFHNTEIVVQEEGFPAGASHPRLT